MKKLPKIYQTEFKKKINNNKKSCYLEKQEQVSSTEETKSLTEITKTIDEIFSGIGYSFNIPVLIKTKDATYDTYLIAKTKNNLVTLDNKIILLSEILDIKKKKNS